MLKNEVLMEGNQFFFLPNVVWRVFTSWYGTAGHQGGPALPRIVSLEMYIYSDKIINCS